MIIESVQKPAAEPVSPEQAKLRLRVDSDAEIDVIGEMITSAREALEGYLRRSIAKQTWRAVLDRFPDDRWISLPMPPAISVSSVKYLDSDAAEQTFSSGSYTLIGDDEGAKIALNDGASWPSALCKRGAVKIEFVAGYEAAPEWLRAHVLGLLAIWFDDRTKQGQIPAGFASQDRIFA
jgi:uncharacterized phiE125 gp8 family phage protein